MWCDFGAAESLRRFTNPFDDEEEEDNGWLFRGDPFPAGNVYTAKIYHKFKIDSTRGDVNGNWKVVNNHRLKIGLEAKTSVVDPQAKVFTKPHEVAAYGSIVGFDDTKTRTKTVVTRRDGSASVVIEVGKKEADALVPLAADLSQWKDEITAPRASSHSIPVYKLPDLTAEGERVTWFPPPSDIRATVIYQDNGKYPDWKYKAHHLDGSSTRSSASDRIVFDVRELNKYTTDENRIAFSFISLSSDGKKALLNVWQPQPGLESCRDLYVGDTITGYYQLVKTYVTGGSTGWSPKGLQYAYISEPMETAFGDLTFPEEKPSLSIIELKHGEGRSVFTDTYLDGADMSWSPDDDLYFSTFAKPRSGNTFFAPNLYRSSTRGVENLGIGRSARVSPDGKWVAFYGMEDVGRCYSYSQMSLCVMRVDGSERRALNRRSNGIQPDILWTPDSENLVEIDDGTVREWNLHTGRFREVATLKLTPRPRTNPDESYRNRLTAASVSKSGRYLFITNRQLVNDPKNRGYSVNINVWFALDLQNGALHKLALFRNGDFDWREE